MDDNEDSETHRYSCRTAFQDVLFELLQLPCQVEHLICRAVIRVWYWPYNVCVLLRLRRGELSDHQINKLPPFNRTAKPARPTTQSHQPPARTTIPNLRNPIRSGRSGSIHSPSRNYSLKATTWLILRVFFVREVYIKEPPPAIPDGLHVLGRTSLIRRLPLLRVLSVSDRTLRRAFRIVLTGSARSVVYRWYDASHSSIKSGRRARSPALRGSSGGLGVRGQTRASVLVRGRGCHLL
jgi:hypothetical protein